MNQQYTFSARALTFVGLITDVTMVGLISLNLGWIFFDTLFESQSVQDIVYWLSPGFYEFYLPIHGDFLRYDLFFVTLYLAEFTIRWVYALAVNQFKHWYTFPLVHWYDLIGCIPIGAFHALRIFRIIVILKRLQDLQIIQWQNTPLIKFFRKYTAILTEEISDRVVVQVLNGMASELRHGTPVLHQVTSHALSPRIDEISELLSNSVTRIIQDSYDSRKHTIREEIAALVSSSAKRSQDLKRLTMIPLLGDYAGESLERTITHMVFDITDQIVEYMRSDLSTTVIEESLHTLLKAFTDAENQANHLVQAILLDTIEVIKQQVQVQQWKNHHDYN